MTEEVSEAKAPPEKKESLWLLLAAPLIWAAHFVLSYATVAIWCAKIADLRGPLGTARWMVGLYTAIALLGIAAISWRAWRQHSLGSATVPHDFDTAEDRHRFLGFAALLLCSMSAVATIYVALGALLIESCA